MKKLLFYALFISSSIILLSPLNAFAQSDSYYRVGYKNTNYNTYDNYAGYIGQQSNGLTQNTVYTTTLYYQNFTINGNLYDYVEIPIYFHFVDTEAYSDGMIITSNGIQYIFANNLIFNFWISFDNGNGSESYTSCKLENYSLTGTEDINGILHCEVPHSNNSRILHLDMRHYSNVAGTYNLFFGTNCWFNFVYKGDDGSSSITNAINNQTSSITQAQQGTTNAINGLNSSINSSSTTDANNSGNSFFSGFQTESFGHLTDIITAPLTLFSAMTSTTCNPITLNVDFSDSTNGAVGSNNVVLPCGTTLFWENSSLGSKVSNFRTFWNILLGAPLIYGCLLLLVKAIDSALDPLNDELITLNVTKNDDKRIEKIQKQDELKKQARGGS